MNRGTFSYLTPDGLARLRPLRILVTGSRTWEDHAAVFDALNVTCDRFGLNYPPDEHGNTMPDPNLVTVVHGDCPTGADHWVDQWAIANCDTRLAEPHPADWNKYGRRAGYLRNAEMVNLGASLCLAFIRDGSPGATMTAQLARRRGIPTRIVLPGERLQWSP